MTQIAEELLTVSEVGKKLRVDDTTVRRWIKNGVLEAISLPHVALRQAYRIRSSTINKLLETTTSETQKAHEETHQQHSKKHHTHEETHSQHVGEHQYAHEKETHKVHEKETHQKISVL